jgi:hypothetical protein
MKKYSFRVVPHTVLPDRPVVEVFRDGEYVAGIYPVENGIRVVSKYLTGTAMEPVGEIRTDKGEPLPSAIITLVS